MDLVAFGLLAAVLILVGVPTIAGHLPQGGASGRGGFPGMGWNLTNAQTEIASLYQANGHSYSAVTPLLLASSAPEFDWLPGGATVGAPAPAVSIDVCADGPACQAVVLATDSRGMHTCWYGVTIDSSRAARAFGLRGAGTFYGSRRNPQACSAGTPGHPARPASGWQATLSAAAPHG